MAESKITLADVKTAEQALNNIMRTQMEFKLAYRLQRIAKKIGTEIDKIEEFRLGLVNKYGVLDEKTKIYNVPVDKQKDFTKEFLDFLTSESELEIQLIPYDMLEKSGIRVSPADLVALEKFITTPPESKDEVNK